MGLRIINRSTPLRQAEQSRERLRALNAQAALWAARKIGDTQVLAANFLEKVEGIRKLDTLNGCVTKKAQDLSDEIRTQAIAHLHDEKAFDLVRILNLI